MMWWKMTFMEALRELLKSFQENPEAARLALVWRTPDEYKVFDEWLLDKIKESLDGATLRVCLWITRQEAAELLCALSGGD